MSASAPGRPLAAVAVALADLLETFGWDGARTVVGGDIRTRAGTFLGRLTIAVEPLDAVVVAGEVRAVDAATFLRAVRGSWGGVAVPQPTDPDAEQRAWEQGRHGPFLDEDRWTGAGTEPTIGRD